MKTKKTKLNPCLPVNGLHSWVKSTSNMYEICQVCFKVRKSGEEEPLKRKLKKRRVPMVVIIYRIDENGNPL